MTILIALVQRERRKRRRQRLPPRRKRVRNKPPRHSPSLFRKRPKAKTRRKTRKTTWTRPSRNFQSSTLYRSCSPSLVSSCNSSDIPTFNKLCPGRLLIHGKRSFPLFFLFLFLTWMQSQNSRNSLAPRLFQLPRPPHLRLPLAKDVAGCNHRYSALN